MMSSNAGGGGERVLWTAIAFMQRTQDDLISVVYTGDMTTTTKEAMIDKVKVSYDSADPLHSEINLPSRDI